MYTLSNKDFLHSFVEATGKNSKAHRGFLRTSSSANSAGILSKAVWRADMDLHILELMQRSICSELLYLSILTESQGRRYLVSSNRFELSKPVHQLGCVFSVRDLTSYDDNHDLQQHCLSTFGLAESLSIPVYDLYRLLGRDHVARLQEQSKIFKTSKEIALRGTRTARLQKNIWKLHAYRENSI